MKNTPPQPSFIVIVTATSKCFIICSAINFIFKTTDVQYKLYLFEDVKVIIQQWNTCLIIIQNNICTWEEIFWKYDYEKLKIVT